MLQIAIYGGTFDPVHKGHIKTALTLQKTCAFDALYFVPCKAPLLKPEAQASAHHRVRMLELALKSHPELQLDLREIQRETPSRMVETLESFRTEYPQASITLILGMDAFLSLPQWFEWNKLTKLAHLLVMTRPGFQPDFSPPLQEVLNQAQTRDKQELKHLRQGKILFMDAGYFDLSSSYIRQNIHKNHVVESMLDKDVLDYIRKFQLYPG